jgi:hypothetical protein
MYASNSSSAVFVFLLSVFHPSSIFCEQKSTRSQLSVLVQVHDRPGHCWPSRRPLTCKIRVINLRVPETSFVQNLQLFAVCFRNIGKVFFVAVVHIFGVGQAFLVPVRIMSANIWLAFALTPITQRQLTSNDTNSVQQVSTSSFHAAPWA